MNKIIKMGIISGLLPLISGCSAAFKDKPETMFEITLNGGAAIKCSSGRTESPIENASVALKNSGILDKLPSPFGTFSDLPITKEGENGGGEDKSVNNSTMMLLAFTICKDIMLEKEKKEKKKK